MKRLPDTFPLLEVIDTAEAIAKTARRHRKLLSGGGFYAMKFAESHAEALNVLKSAESQVRILGISEVTKAFEAVVKGVQVFFDARTANRERGHIKSQILLSFKSSILPALQKNVSVAPSDNFFPLEILKNTRSYIEKVGVQACGCYDMKWFDGAAVMARRLLETLIIELYEAKKLDHKIKKPDGSFQYLSGLVSVLLAETAFNVGRNARKSILALKDLGDQSAHNRRYIARQQDLDNLKRDLRVTIEELVVLTEFKTSAS